MNKVNKPNLKNPVEIEKQRLHNPAKIQEHAKRNLKNPLACKK